MAHASWQAAVRSVAKDLIGGGTVPGLIVAVARGGDPPESVAFGTDWTGTPLAADSLYPVASVTKPATALAVLRLVAAGAVALDDPLGRFLPEAAAARTGVTLRALFSHTSGLPMEVVEGSAPYEPGLDWPKLARACLVTPLERKPGKRVGYSNVGIGLLAIVVERLTGRAFPAALHQLVLDPLGIEAYLGEEPPRPVAKVGWERPADDHETELESFNSPFWQSLALPWGGLVTTAAGACSLVRAFAGTPSGFLPPAILAEAQENQTDRLPGGISFIKEWPHCPWGLGIEVRGDKSPHWTPKTASRASFGHVGSSGTQAWHDPERDVTWAIFGTWIFTDWWQQMGEIGAAVLGSIRD